MKKLLSILFILLFANVVSAGTIQQEWCSIIAKKAGVTSCTLLYDPVVTWDQGKSVGYWANAITGFIYDPASNQDLCQVDFYVISKSGNISSKTYYVGIWSLNGSDQANVLIGTSDAVSGGDISASTYQTFSFSSSLSLSTGTSYGIGIYVSDYAADTSNYFNLGVDNGGTPGAPDGGVCEWTHSGALPYGIYSQAVTSGMDYKIYTDQ